MLTKMLTNKNYFSPEAQRQYWSASQFKSFMNCEAAALAELAGVYEHSTSTALLVGSYVDAFYSGELEQFKDAHPEIINSRTKELKADYQHADDIIERINRDPLMSDYLTGEKQKIYTASLFDVPWKIKVDVINEDRIVDLKIVKDFDSIYKDGHGWLSWIEYWAYDIQGAIYQKIEQLASGRTEPLPFYIAAATKEKTPDIAVIQIPQPILDTALQYVESKIERFDLVKSGEVEPIRCEKCDYCKESKVLSAPAIYEREGE